MNLKRKILSMLKNKLYLKHNNGNLKEVDLILLSEKTDPRADNLFEIFKNQFSQSAKYKMMKIIRKKNKKYNKKNRQKNKNNINKK